MGREKEEVEPQTATLDLSKCMPIFANMDAFRKV
jgi:hypothetical protein